MRTPTSASLARLLAWDAPFFPAFGEVSGDPDAAFVVCRAPGLTLDAATRWPRGQRAAVALQVMATAAFLFERGWYPSRALLRGGRVERGDGGPWYRLGRLPAWRLEDADLERRLRPVLGHEETVLVPAVLPLLRKLLPELSGDLEHALVSRPAWEAVGAWLKVLLSESRASTALRHPAGLGRALWARRLALPRSGVHFIDDDSLLERLTVVARLVSLGTGVVVAAGALEEEEIAKVQARAAASGRDVLVLTTLSLPGVPGLCLDGGTDAVWVAATRPELAHAHGASAYEAGARRPLLARAVLEAGAAEGFAMPPRPMPMLRERSALASAGARHALGWLGNAPVGLAEDDLVALPAIGGTALVELERLGLVQKRRGQWRALHPAIEPAGDKLEEMAVRLPAESAAGLVARALARAERGPLVAWCEQRLEGGDAHGVLDVAQAVPTLLELYAVGAEAALRLGRLAYAERFLAGVPAELREARWHALAAWRAEEASASAEAGVELAAVAGDLPARLAARCELVAAHAARRKGDRVGQRGHLERATALVVPPLAEAEIGLAELDGRQALRALGRRRRAVWGGDDVARLLHVVGLAALDRGCCAAAMTALRAALRAASGDNPHLLGEIHADIAYSAILGEQPGVADRHLVLAESLLDRSGSLRAATVVRANRAVLADDRLDWRTGRHLTLTGQSLRGNVDDAGTLLFELEIARADLARGDAGAAQSRLPRLVEGVGRFPEHPGLGQALAGLHAHAALALGDLSGAAAAASGAENGERQLIEALVRADAGADPPAGLPRRWGVTISAQLLAAWRRGDAAEARARLELALRHWPREAAVGVARFAALLARRGERLGPDWEECEKAAEAVLVGAELEGWARVLRGASGPDPVRIVRALDGMINSGSDALGAARLEALARALDLRWLEVECDGSVLAAWGEPPDEKSELEAAGVKLRSDEALSGVARAALGMLARNIAARTDGTAPEQDRAGGDLLGVSEALVAVREQVSRWGPLPLTVLVVGEPGTGKELVAREIHNSSGRRGAFVPLNCAGIPGPLLEAELFGVIKGAYTGADRDRQGLVEAAEDGTLFLDEVGELPLELQGKILRLLQEREVRRVGATRSRTVDVRFIAATNRDLKAAAAAGGFRWDLYYRLAVAIVEVPPLRARPADIDGLAKHFVSRFATMLNRPGVRLAPAAIEVLRGAPWPGNVRELESAVARAVAAARPGEVLGPDRFPDLTRHAHEGAPLLIWPAALEAFRRDYFKAVLQETGGNKSQAARRAGISRQTLLYHLKELGIRGGEGS